MSDRSSDPAGRGPSRRDLFRTGAMGLTAAAVAPYLAGVGAAAADLTYAPTLACPTPG
jgi:hypothetical protein